MKTLNQDLKERSFKPVYCLYGEEAFLKRSYKNRFKEAILGDDERIRIIEPLDVLDFHNFLARGYLILTEQAVEWKTLEGETYHRLSL